MSDFFDVHFDLHLTCILSGKKRKIAEFSEKHKSTRGQRKVPEIVIYQRFQGLFLWQGHQGSNSGHSVLETDALPAELYPYVVGHQGLEPRTDRL